MWQKTRIACRDRALHILDVLKRGLHFLLQQLVFLFLGKQIVCADREKEGMMRGMRDEVRTQNTELTKVVQDWKKITTKMTAQQHKRAHFSLPNAFKNITLHLNKKNYSNEIMLNEFLKKYATCVRDWQLRLLSSRCGKTINDFYNKRLKTLLGV